MEETAGAKDGGGVLRTYTELGVASVVCGVLGVCFLVLMFLPGIMVLSFFVLTLGILAVIFGAFAYWGMKRDSLGLLGFSLGAFLVIMWFFFYVYSSVRGVLGGPF